MSFWASPILNLTHQCHMDHMIWRFKRHLPFWTKIKHLLKLEKKLHIIHHMTPIFILVQNEKMAFKTPLVDGELKTWSLVTRLWWQLLMTTIGDTFRCNWKKWVDAHCFATRCFRIAFNPRIFATLWQASARWRSVTITGGSKFYFIK